MSELIVFLGKSRVGKLIRKPNGNMQFRYDSNYAGPPVSQSLPVQSEAHPHRARKAVFGGLLPEGEVRDSMARNLGISAGNEYGMLEAVGGDCAGAIMLLPPDTEPNWVAATVQIDEAELDRLIQDLPRRPLAAAPNRGIRLSLAGAQDKLPIIVGEHGMAEPLTVGAPTTHIIKPEPQRFPGLVANEAFCMDLAAGVGLATAAISRAETLSGRPYLLVERFDRVGDGEAAARLHQEDFCQALGYPSELKYQADGGPTIDKCIDLIRSASAAPALDLAIFWNALVFNWLIGNCDAHAKNYSLLYQDGSARLAPLYDLVSTTIYPELTRIPAMRVGSAGDVEQVDFADWKELARATGIAERLAGAELSRFAGKVVAEAELLHASDDHGKEIVAGILDGIRRRARKVADA